MAGQVSISIGDKEWTASLAATPWELTQGLGGIAGIPAGTGMLFDLGYEQAIEVTTVPMLFPLDIAFFSEDLAVTEVYQDAEPGLLLTSVSPARYFLEVNAGELEGVEAGEVAEVAWLPQQAPQAPSWTTALYGFMGMLVAAALLSTLVRGVVPAALPESAEPRLLAHTRPNRKPTRGEVSVHSWTERDRLGIWIVDSPTDKTLAEWWDDDARQMFEDGFFKPGIVRHQEISGHDFEKSVLDYAEYLGILAGDKSAATRPAPHKKASGKPDSGKRSRLEYLPDSPELLAWTIEDIGYRDQIDSAFTQAIARARKGR